jgi:uncharacterized protein with PQ loop repeat
MTAMWLTTVGFLAAGTGMTVAVPQVLRLLRSGHADGVSLPTTVLGCLTAGTWLTYGLLLLDATQILANVPALAGASTVAALVVRRTGTRRAPLVAGALAWAAVVVAAHLAGGANAVGNQPPVWLCALSSVVISGLVLARRLRPGRLAPVD